MTGISLQTYLNSVPEELAAMLGDDGDYFQVETKVYYSLLTYGDYGYGYDRSVEVEIESINCQALKSNLLPYLNSKEIAELENRADGIIWDMIYSIDD